jgi:hypothetical protein
MPGEGSLAWSGLGSADAGIYRSDDSSGKVPRPAKAEFCCRSNRPPAGKSISRQA